MEIHFNATESAAEQASSHLHRAQAALWLSFLTINVNKLASKVLAKDGGDPEQSLQQTKAMQADQLES